MDCNLAGICGGCALRGMPPEEYRQYKISCVKQALQSITRQDFSYDEPVFIADGGRRRASLAFRYGKGQIVLGFNSLRSNAVNQVENCPLLTARINRNLPFLRQVAAEICRIKITQKIKKGKNAPVAVRSGDVFITEADNGLDVVLEFLPGLNLEMRQLIFEAVLPNPDIVRLSYRGGPEEEPETIMEKSRPHIQIAGRDVYIPAGTFLQPSKAGEKALIDLVLRYLGGSGGKIADLFCGVGTFSYPLAADIANKITAVDSSAALLRGFQESVNRQMIPNIEIVTRNLFKYPLAGKELAPFNAVVFDPPRAGAKEQVRALAALPAGSGPEKVVAVSCNPSAFARDAEILQNGGYCLQKVTIVDQFVYSRHSELVAVFVRE